MTTARTLIWERTKNTSMFGLFGTLEITPFCSLVLKNEEKCFIEYRWSEQRSIESIKITFPVSEENGVMKRECIQPIVKIEYWKAHWPEEHQQGTILKGSGQSGWTARDDWFSGTWKQADTYYTEPGDGTQRETGPRPVVLAFHPLNEREFPNQPLDVTYRRTLKLRVYFNEDDFKKATLEHVHVFTGSGYASKSFVVSSPKAMSIKDKKFIATIWNGYFVEEGKKTRKTRETCTFDQGFEVVACIRHGSDRSDDAIMTIETPGNSAFSFRCSDVDEHGRVFIPDLDMLVQHEGQQISYKEANQRWINSKQVDPQEPNDDDTRSNAFYNTIYDTLFKIDEQTLHQAMERFSGKERMHFVLGCDGTRAKCALSRSGNIYTSNRYLVKVPGPDTRQVFWKKQYFKVGFEFSVDGTFRGSDITGMINGRDLLDGFLPIITNRWSLGDEISVTQEAYATLLQRTVPGKEPTATDEIVVMVCFKIKNEGEVERNVRLDVVTGEVSTIDDSEFPVPVFSEVYLNPANQVNAKMLELSGNGLPSYFMHVNQGDGEIKKNVDGLNPISLHVLVSPGNEQTVFFRVPLLAIKASLAISALDRLDFDKERVRVAIYWMDRLEEAANIETPEPHFNNFYKAHLIHVLTSNDREVGTNRIFGRVGSLNYGTFANEVCMISMDLDRRGMFEDAKRILDVFLEYQGTAGLLGDYEDIEGMFFGANGYECGEGYNQNQGFVLWAIAEHVRMSGDMGWLKDIASKVIKACDWITRERRARARTMSEAGICGGADIELLTSGLLPPGGLEDVRDFWDWLSTNAYNAFGMVQAVDVLLKANHPDVQRISADAMEYLRAVRNVFFRASYASPVVALKDGSFVPHFPCRIPLRGRGYGWIQETLEGAIHLIRCWIVHPCSIEATWILKDYEDNLYLSDNFGYQLSDENFKKEWFNLGGFSQQPFLLCSPYPYLQRGEINHYLRAVMNAFSVNYRDDTVSFCEHPLPTVMDVRGDFFKPSDEANFCGCLRDMLVLEVNKKIYLEHFGKINYEFAKRSHVQFEKHGEMGGWEAADTIALFQGTPREWIQHGKEIHVTKLPTQFGMVNFDLVSHVDDNHVKISIFIEQRENVVPWKEITGIFITTRHPDKNEVIIDVQGHVYINGNNLEASSIQQALIKNQSFFVDLGKKSQQWDTLSVNIDVLFKNGSKSPKNPQIFASR